MSKAGLGEELLQKARDVGFEISSLNRTATRLKISCVGHNRTSKGKEGDDRPSSGECYDDATTNQTESDDKTTNGKQDDAASSMEMILREIQANIPDVKEMQLHQLNHLEILPDALCEFFKLKTLRILACNSLKEFPSSIRGLSANLETLEISGWGNDCAADTSNLMTKLTSQIGYLVNLKKLKLSFLHSLESLPSEIGSLHALERLDLYYCPRLKVLPPEIGQLRSLRDFNLYCPELERLPDEIGQLGETLNKLSMSYGGDSFTRLPESIGNLSNLEKLELYGCRNLLTLPSGIAQLQQLEHLLVQNVDLFTCLPDEIGSLGKSLTSLKITNCCNLSELLPASSTTILGRLKHLEDLSLYALPIRSIPSDIGNLCKSLTSLDLSYCSSLEEIPPAIQLLSNLSSLTVDYCSSLRLHRTHNVRKLLSVLPGQLDELHLQGNEICSLEGFRSYLTPQGKTRRLPTGLTCLNLTGNPIIRSYCPGWKDERSFLEDLLLDYPQLGLIAPQPTLAKIMSPYAAFLLAYNQRWRALFLGDLAANIDGETPNRGGRTSSGTGSIGRSKNHRRGTLALPQSVWSYALALAKKELPTKIDGMDLEAILIFQMLRECPSILQHAGSE